MEVFPKELEDFGNAFVNAQAKRHTVDYDPSFRMTRSEVLSDISAAEAAIGKLKSAKMKDRRALSAWVTLANRN